MDAQEMSDVHDMHDQEYPYELLLTLAAQAHIFAKPYAITWMTMTRTDRPQADQIANIAEVGVFPAILRFQDLLTSDSLLVRGRTIGLAQHRNLNLTVNTRFLRRLVPAGFYLPPKTWVDMIMSEPFLDPDGPLRSTMFMPLVAAELKKLSTARRDGKDSLGPRALDELDARIAKITDEQGIRMDMNVMAIHPDLARQVHQMKRREEMRAAAREKNEPFFAFGGGR
jgi:hypothetical protein